MDINEVLSRKTIALGIFFIVALLFLLPIFANIANWGFYDWDQHFFYHGSARNSIVKFAQVPLWNPFYCGGMPLLANPQSVFLSPFFLFVLIFDTVVGIKLEILAYLVLGLFGMFLLSRKLGMKAIPSYLSAFVFMLSTWFSARVLVGHTTFFPFALLPWAVLFYFYEKRHFALLSSVVLAVMFLSGGVYPFYFTAMFLGLYALFDSIEKKSIKPISTVLLILLFAVLFSAVKLVPTLEYTKGMSQQDVQLNSVSMEIRGLLALNQDVIKNDAVNGRNSAEENLPEKTLAGEVPWGWHEYSAYIGIFALLLVLVSALNYRKNWKLLVIAALFFILSLGDFSPVPLWSILRQIPFLGALHGPSRLLIMFVFSAALLAGKALSDIKPINNRYFAGGMLLIVLLNLFFVSRPLLSDAFVVEPLSINTDDFTEYIHIYSGDQFLSQYPNMLQNLDTVNCYERIHPKTMVVPQITFNGELNKKFIGNAFLSGTNRTFPISYFSPNRVVVDVNNASGSLVLNQNYLPGWKARGKEVFSYSGLIAAKVERADRKIEFYYAPETFYIGIVISLIGIAFAVSFFKRWRQ